MRFPPVCRHRPQSLIGLLPRADNAEAVSCPSSEAGTLADGRFIFLQRSLDHVREPGLRRRMEIMSKDQI